MDVIRRTADDIHALHQADVSPEVLRDCGTSWLGKVVPKPWGEEVEIYRSGTVSIWRLTLNPGCETSMHCHPRKDTVLVVEAGDCIVETLGGFREVKAGEMVHLQRGAFHRTRTNGGAMLVEVESPANKRDLVRLNDKYGRGQGY